MGIDPVTARFLAFCKKSGVDFSRTITLGRQSLYVSQKELCAILRETGIEASATDVSGAYQSEHYAFSDGVFQIFGAQSVESVDASGYEGASIIHDLNRPIADNLSGRYSAVVDGGTLEHIFNFPTAVENCMRMLEVGGHFISVAPANNFFGHGFYQFSSELFFRVFSKENGFEVQRVFLTAEKPFRSWYEVVDPAAVKERVFLRNQVSTFQLFFARKIGADAGLWVTPQQSDYDCLLWQGTSGDWTSHGSREQLRKGATLRKIAAMLPLSVSRGLRAIRPIVVGASSPPFRHEHLKKIRA